MTALPVAIDLRTDRRTDPIGLDEPRPRLSWRVELAKPAARQASFAIEVASQPTFARTTIVWARTGVVGADPAIVYDGPQARSRERRVWRVRLVDDRGAEGPWSAPASWEAGLLDPDDWGARWI
ncbi:MAG: alpha-L-rhamnosidase, partial [Actinomycetota bacterium]|nr:alpha-L-rhamnosidase [Actinomycetota bacterium]